MLQRFVIVATTMLVSGCSLTLDFTDCQSDDDCSDGRQCVDAICQSPPQNDGGESDMGPGIDATGDATVNEDGGDDVTVADVSTDAADAADVDPDRPLGRTACPERPTSDITEPKTTIGNGNAASCTFDELRSAIAGGGLITFDCGVDPHTINFNERVVIDNDVHIDGGGLITFDTGNTATRFFTLDTTFQSDSPHLVLEELTIQNGQATTDDDFCGGAVTRTGGTLTIIGSTFLNNRCTSETSNGDPVGGAIAAIDGGPLTIFGSEFRNNHASGGGAIFVRDTDVTITNTTFANNEATGLSGGALTSFDQSDVSICGSTFQQNHSANFGGGIFYWDTEAPRASLSIAQSSFVGNTSVEDGGAGDLEGALLTIDSSTFDTNVSERGGALWLGDDEFAMVNVTFRANEATNESGGAMFYANSTGDIEHGTFAENLDGGAPGSVIGSAPDAEPSVTLRNSILVDSSNRSDKTLCTVAQTDEGGNLQWPEGSTPCTEQIVFADPLLGDLSANGGRTDTMVPAADSAAERIGNDCPRFDQRGIVRPFSECTSGAVQME